MRSAPAWFRPAFSCLSAALLVCVGPTFAQIPLDTTARSGVPGVPLQDGRRFEANPLLGSGGLNYVRPTTPFLGGNPYASGNVRGGFALRSYSPISDPTAFRASLGSSTLSNFQRDSVSLFDRGMVVGSGLQRETYFDPARTAPSASYLRGIGSYAPQTASLGVRQDSPSRIGTPMDLRIQTQFDASSFGEALTNLAGFPPAGVSSSMFGASNPLGTASIPAYTPRIPAGLTRPDGSGLESSPALDDLRDDSRIDYRALLGQPLDVRMRSENLRLSGRLGDPPAGAGIAEAGSSSMPLPPLLPAPGVQARTTEQGLVAASELEAAERRRRQAELLRLEPAAVDASLLPGNDLYNDMRMALSLDRDPNAVWFKQLQELLKPKEAQLSDPASEIRDPAAHLAEAGAVPDASDFVRRVLKTPMRNLYTEGRTPLNDELLKAESLMEIGHYYEAAARYEYAHALDPANPLPLIGKGHALLAAGDYSSAATALIRGLEIFPELSRFPLDLSGLIGGGEILDLRRADILKRLSQKEDANLLFLLGYVEYHSGNREMGLAHLDKAARLDPTGSIIARYPSMLRGEGALPPPRAPVLTPPALIPPGDAGLGSGSPAVLPPPPSDPPATGGG